MRTLLFLALLMMPVYSFGQTPVPGFILRAADNIEAAYIAGRKPVASVVPLSLSIALQPVFIFVTPFYLHYMHRHQFGKATIGQFLFSQLCLIYILYFIIQGEMFTGTFIQLISNDNKLSILAMQDSLLSEVNWFLLLVFIFFLSFASFKKVNRDLLFGSIGGFLIMLGLFSGNIAVGVVYGFPFVVYSILGNTQLANIPKFTYTVLGGIMIIISTHWAVELRDLVVMDALYSLSFAILLFLIYWILTMSIYRNEQLKKTDNHILIGIGGDSASGKHTLVKILGGIVGEDRSIQIFGDDFHRWERGHDNWEDFTHLDPQANRLHESLDVAMKLKEGKVVKWPHYDHSLGKFSEPEEIKPEKFIFVVGLHPFYLEEMRNLFDLKVFVDIDDDLRKLRKIQRDVKKRGYQWDQVLEQINSRFEDKVRHIEPQKDFADLVIRYDSVEKIDFLIPTEAIPKVSTSYSISNSVNIDQVVKNLRLISTLNIDYITSVHKQVLTVTGDIPLEEVVKIAVDMDINLHELDINPSGWLNTWVSGHNGVSQLIFLLVYNHKQKVIKDR